jgi:hypothetical protein
LEAQRGDIVVSQVAHRVSGTKRVSSITGSFFAEQTYVAQESIAVPGEADLWLIEFSR